MELGASEKGKMAELAVFSELMKRGIVPYIPLVDVKGVDAVISKSRGGYIELQVKATFTEEMEGSFNVDDLIEKPNLFIIGVVATGIEYEYWIFPSGVFLKYAKPILHSRKGYTTYRLDLWYGKRKYGAYLKDILSKYRNNWCPLVG